MRNLPLNWFRICLLVGMVALAVLPTPTAAAPLHQEDDPQAQADALFDEGWALLQDGQLEAALPKFEGALPFYHAAGDRPGEALCLLAIGFVREQLADYPGALNAYEASLPILREIGYREGEGTTLSSVGRVYDNLVQYQQALDHYQQALAIYREIGDRQGEETMLNNIQALAVLPAPTAAAPLDQEDDPQAQADALFDEGWALFEAGKLEAALQKFEAALALYQAAGDRPREALCLLVIGFVRQRLADYPGAVNAYEASLPIWREIGDRSQEGTTLNNIGAVYKALGQYPQALDYFQQALPIAEEIGDRSQEAATLSNIGGVYANLGQYQQALDYYQQALAIAQDIGHRTGEGTTLSNIGLVYDSLGQYQLALEHHQQALAIAQDIGHRTGERTTLNNIGAVYRALGQYPQALDYYQRALAIAEEIGDRAQESTTLNNIGVVYLALGQYRQALNHHQQALAIAQDIGHRTGEGVALNSIGAVYYNLGQYQQALDHYQQALLILQEIGYRAGEGTTLNNIGLVYLDLGQYQQALDHHQQALAICQEIGDRAQEGKTLISIGAVYRRALGQYPQALDYYQRALAIAEEIGDRAQEAATLNNTGEVYRDLGQYQQALDHYQQALAICQEIGYRAWEGTALHNIGLLYESQGNMGQAIAYCQRSIEVIESIQGEIKVEESKASFAGGRVGTYELLINLLWQEGRFEDAFSYAERARARAFLDQIGNQQVDFRRGVAPELAELEQALRQQIFDLQNDLNAERAKPFDQQSQELLDKLSSDLEQARNDYKALLNRLKLESPEYATLVSVNTINLEEVQTQVLDEQTTLVAYFVMGDQTLAWVIDQEGFELVSLDITRDDLRNKVEFLRNLIADRDFDKQTAASLSDGLFGPLKSHIRYSNLIIVPHGVLHYLPFAALWNAEQERYLLQDYPITYAPSASVLQFILYKRNAEEGRLLALGDPDGSLPNAAMESQAVAGLYRATPLLGQQATETQVHNQAGQLDLLHLAAHGVYNPFNPLFTRIELAPDDAHDGNLEVHEVFGLDLTDANLVVLSACETALGEQSEGDELVGLTRAFLYAGTPSVVTTLWSINDAASGVLMESFYRYLQDGLTNAEALRAAQLDVLAQDKWRTPYYWAAFNLTGDYRGSGEPGMVMEETPEPTAAAEAGETPTSTPAVEAQPTPTPDGSRGICGSAGLPLGLVVLAGIQRKRMRRRTRS